MAFFLQNIFYFALLLVLLCVSGLFSGAETVLFSLSRHERARMKKSKNRLEVMAANLMEDPRSLLTSLLMGNMTCNIIVFVISTLLLERLERVLSDGRDTSTWTARLVIALLVGVPPLMVTYVADVFPKVVGSLNNTRIAPLIALPVATLVRVLWPISRAVDVGIMRPVHRLVSGGRDRGTGAGFSTEELHDLLELSEKQGVIDVSENELLQEVVRIADLKVRDVMTPRVDMVAFNIKEPAERLVALFQKTHLAKVPVYDGQIDNLLGLVYAKTLLLEAGDGGTGADLRRVMQPVRFVPELQTLDRLLVHFRQTRTQLAVVVDEFGGVVGVVALEDVVEQMVGDIQELHDAAAPAVQRVGTDEYLVPGDLSVADWMDAFGARVETTHTTTVAGLLAAILKRLPREGDEVRLDHLKMRVESMRGRRVDKVRLQLVSASKDEEQPTEGRR
jgi:putative hemolysin